MSVRLALFLAAAVLMPAHATRGGDPVLPGVSDGRHLWVLAPVDDGTVRILHHHPAPPCGLVSIQRSLSRRPEAMAAWDGRLWLVFPAEPADDAAARRREIFTIEARYQDALGGYLTFPPDRLGVETPLPGDGRLAGLVGTPGGPAALLLDAEVSLPDTAEAEPPGPRLLQLVGGRWQPEPLPPDLDPAAIVLLASPAAGGSGLTILSRSAGDTSVHRRDTAGRWIRSQVPVPPDDILGAARIGPSLGLLRAAGEQLRLSYVRGDGVLDLPPFQRPADVWTTLGLADGLRIIELPATLPARGSLPASLVRIARVDPVSGVAGPLEPAPTASTPLTRMWHVSLLLAVAFTAVVAMVVLRPGGRPLNLPDRLEPLPLGARGGALALDLVPGVVITMLVTGVGLRALAESPMWLFTARLDRALPFVLAVSITVTHATIVECLTGRSLGKLMVGARIVTPSGDPPPKWRLVLRGIVKLLVLLLPVLVLPALLNPNLRGLHDLAAGTLVAGERDEDAPAKRDGDAADS